MIEIYPLELKDCERVAMISATCLPEAWSYASICDTLRYDNNIYYVAKDIETNEVVGFGGIMIVGDEAELLNIAVLPNYRRKQIATNVLSHLLRKAAEEGAYRMLLEVRESNIQAQSLYEKMGFVKIGIRSNYYSHPTEHACIMAYSL